MDEVWIRFRAALADVDIAHHNLIDDAALLQTQRDDARSDLARVTAERDALRAEVEAMREVVEAVNAAQDEAAQGRDGFGHYCDAVQMANALRAKGG